MELEEAKKKLELMEYKYTLTNNDDKAIETVLQSLENSVSKDIIRQKINERQFELQQEYKDFKDDIKLKTLQEIYYFNNLEDE